MVLIYQLDLYTSIQISLVRPTLVLALQVQTVVPIQTVNPAASNRFRLVFTRLCAPRLSLKPPSWPVSFWGPLVGRMTRDLRYFLWDSENFFIIGPTR